MSDESKPAEKRLAPRASRDSEKALGLEVARLFGLNPRLLAAKTTPPVKAGEGDRSGPEPPEKGGERTPAPDPEDAGADAD